MGDETRTIADSIMRAQQLGDRSEHDEVIEFEYNARQYKLTKCVPQGQGVDWRAAHQADRDIRAKICKTPGPRYR